MELRIVGQVFDPDLGADHARQGVRHSNGGGITVCQNTAGKGVLEVEGRHRRAAAAADARQDTDAGGNDDSDDDATNERCVETSLHMCTPQKNPIRDTLSEKTHRITLSAFSGDRKRFT